MQNQLDSSGRFPGRASVPTIFTERRFKLQLTCSHECGHIQNIHFFKGQLCNSVFRKRCLLHDIVKRIVKMWATAPIFVLRGTGQWWLFHLLLSSNKLAICIHVLILPNQTLGYTPSDSPLQFPRAGAEIPDLITRVSFRNLCVSLYALLCVCSINSLPLYVWIFWPFTSKYLLASFVDISYVHRVTYRYMGCFRDHGASPRYRRDFYNSSLFLESMPHIP